MISRAGAQFSQLPQEILLAIAKFAEPEACLSLLEVNKYFLQRPCADINTRLVMAFIYSRIPEHFGSTLFTTSELDARYL